MPRIQPIDPDAATGRVKEIFDGPLKGKARNIFRSMGASPAALDMYLAMSQALGRCVLSPAEREVIQLALAEANNCAYCVAAHTAIGKQVGLTETQAIEARRGTLADPRLDALAKFTLAMHEKNGFVGDADVAAFRRAGYGDAHIADAVACYALAVFTNTFNHVNETPIDFPAAPAL